MIGHDKMQVCLNGHVVTNAFRYQGNSRIKACPKCGEDTLTACENCGEDIPGALLDNQGLAIEVREGPQAPPNYCVDCREPFPWTTGHEEFEDLDSSVLDPELKDRVLDQFENGHYQSAYKDAFLVLEERIRDKAELPQSMTGATLAVEAFKPNSGPLTFGDTGGEQEGVMLLYKGAFQALRNPSNHRFLDEIDEDYARDAIHTVNLLLRLIRENT